MSSGDYQSIKLKKDSQVQEILEARKIDDDEIKMVIHNAETKGEKFYRQGTDKFLAKARIANATVNVEYAPAGENTFSVLTAYIHRAVLLEE